MAVDSIPKAAFDTEPNKVLSPPALPDSPIAFVRMSLFFVLLGFDCKKYKKCYKILFQDDDETNSENKEKGPKSETDENKFEKMAYM